MIPTALTPPRRRLMGPGPSEVPDSVLHALAKPTLGHLDPYFLTVMRELQQMLQQLWQTRGLTFPLSATGTSGMEACLSNLLEPGDRALIGVNGVFGQRMVQMAERAGAEVTRVDGAWGRPLDPAAFRLAAKGRRHKVLAMVHAETSTGVHNPLAPMRGIANEFGSLLVADCVTSLGGMPVQFDHHGLDAAYSASQKCLGVPSGTAPIALSDRARAAMAARKTPPNSWYLDLNLLQSYWGEPHRYHHTAPSNLMVSLHEGLRLALTEGLDARYARFQMHARALWAGLTAMGLTLPVKTGDRLHQLTLVAVPDGVDEAAVRRALLTEYGIEIGGGLGVFAGKAWRIGLMGAAAQRGHVSALLTALASALRANGFTPRADGLAAADAVWETA